MNIVCSTGNLLRKVLWCSLPIDWQTCPPHACQSLLNRFIDLQGYDENTSSDVQKLSQSPLHILYYNKPVTKK